MNDDEKKVKNQQLMSILESANTSALETFIVSPENHEYINHVRNWLQEKCTDPENESDGALKTKIYDSWFICAEKNNLSMLLQIKDLSIDINMRNGDGMSALLLAIKSRAWEVAHSLIDNKKIKLRYGIAIKDRKSALASLLANWHSGLIQKVLSRTKIQSQAMQDGLIEIVTNAFDFNDFSIIECAMHLFNPQDVCVSKGCASNQSIEYSAFKIE